MTTIYTIILSFLMLLKAGADAFQAKVQSATCIALWGFTVIVVLAIIGIVLWVRGGKEGRK